MMKITVRSRNQMFPVRNHIQFIDKFNRTFLFNTPACLRGEAHP
uniref:Uncharacterized protein n=1 Tax=Anguilla anguilla TaxID=7936 RepID=A0A0E9WRL8_ANGAN